MDYKTTRTIYSIREIKRKIEPIEDGCSAREIMSERLFFSSRRSAIDASIMALA